MFGNPRKIKSGEQLTFPFYREPLKPSQIKRLPLMTDLEFFWGAPEQIDDEKFWFRAFKPLPGKPYQEYFHLYTWAPIRNAMDLRKIIAQCVGESFQTRSHGKHGKIVIQCCPDKYWDPIHQKCVEDRPRFGKRPLFYKILIPETDLGRLLRIGQARRAKYRVRGLKIEAPYLRRNPEEDLNRLAEQARIGDSMALLNLLKAGVRMQDANFIFTTVLEIAVTLKDEAMDQAIRIGGTKFDTDPSYYYALHYYHLLGLVRETFWQLLKAGHKKDPDAIKELEKLMNGDYDHLAMQ